MRIEDFDSRLKELAVLIGSHDKAELFNEKYESLLNEVIRLFPRYEMLFRLRRLLDYQMVFLMNAWLKGDREQWAPGWVQ